MTGGILEKKKGQKDRYFPSRGPNNVHTTNKQGNAMPVAQAQATQTKF